MNPVTDVEYLQKEYDIIEKLLLEIEDYKIIKLQLLYIKDISKITRQIMLKKISPKVLHHLYSGIGSAVLLFNFVKSHDNLYTYLNTKIENFDTLINDMNEIRNYMDSVFILEKCKEIENIQKIENSFIKNDVDSLLDSKIQILMESQDQLEALKIYFSSII